MSRIVAIDEGLLRHPPESVRRALLAVDAYSSWWPRRYRVTRLDPASGADLTVRCGPGLRCRVKLDAEADRIILRLGPGSFEGEARFSLRPVLEGTALVLRLDARPVPLWLRALTRVVDLGRRHSRNARSLFEALAGRLEALGEPRVPEPSPPTGPPPEPGVR
jgi:hypothetical protein